LQLTPEGELSAQQPIKRRFTWRASSRLPPLGESLSHRDQELGLQLPDGISDRTRQLVRQWQGQSQSPHEVVQRALRHFNRQPFIYTLQPPLLKGDPVDQFLFETRKGFCEHYATSFVILMRLAGIPARVVVGYQGGELNPVGGHLVIRQSDAHAWAEVWLDGQGWTRVDPTAAVAPERIEYGIDPGDAFEGEPARFRVSLPDGHLTRIIRTLGWYRDNLQLMWHSWVVGYNHSRQQILLRKLGLEAWHHYHLAVASVLAPLMLATGIFWLSALRRRQRQDPARRAWTDFLIKLRRAGLSIPVHLGPLATGHLACQRFPSRAASIQTIVNLYVAQRYGASASDQELRRLRREVRRLRLMKSSR